MYDQLICNKVPRQFNEERIVFSTNNAGTIGYLYAKKEKKKEEKNLDSYITPYTKLAQNRS